MSDASDWQEQQAQLNQLQAWDPSIGKNVSTPEGAANYVQTHAQNYQDYTGPISYVNNQPITPQAFNNTVPKDPFDAYSQASQRQAYYGPGNLNPYDQGIMDAQQKWAAENVRVLPGARPNVGYIPGYGAINMMNMLPFDAYQNASLKYRHGYDIYPVEQKMADLASRYGNIFPTLHSQTWERGINPNRMFGSRGFRYRPFSPEDQATIDQFLAGSPVNMSQLSQMLSQHVQRVPMSTVQELANKYYGTLLMSIGGTAVGGPIGGALGAAFAQGAQSHWKNPEQILLAAALGLGGGWAGGALGGAVAGPIGAGVGGGIGSAAGRGLAQGVTTGNWDLDQMLRNMAIGGVSGGVGGALGQLGVNPLIRNMASSGTGTLLNTVFPGGPEDRRNLNPYATPSTQRKKIVSTSKPKG